jgi:hypothetical protein
MTRISDDEDVRMSTEGGFNADETPDEIATFLSANGIGDKYQMILKELVEGGRPQYIKGYTNWHPTIDDIGTQWGPGEYEFTFSWREKQINGKMGPVAKSFKIMLPEKAWREPHLNWLAARQEEKAAKKRIELTEEADRARAFGQFAGVQGVQPPSDLDSLKKSLEVLRGLGVPLGAAPHAPKTDWAGVLVGLAPVIAAVAPVAAAFITRKKEDTQAPLLQLLLSKVLDKPQGESEYMKQAFGMAMGMMKNMMDMKQIMTPEEKEPFIERVFDKLVGSMPMVLELAKMSKPQRESNMMYKMAQGHPDVQTIMNDLELQIAFVNKLDAFYGFEQTNQILEVMGVPRPPVTAQNAKHYATPESAEKATETAQEELRGAPSAAPETEEDGLP